MPLSYAVFIREIIDECLLEAKLPLSDVYRVRDALIEQYVDGVLYCSTDYKDTSAFLYGLHDNEFYYIVSFCVQEEYVFLVYKKEVYDSRKWYGLVLEDLKSAGIEGRLVGERFSLLKDLGLLVHGIFHDCIRSKRKSVSSVEEAEDFVYPSYEVLKTYYECGRKRKFDTISDAESSKDSFGSVDTVVYDCPHCGFYHIGRERAKDYSIPEEVMTGRYKTAWRRYQNI